MSFGQPDQRRLRLGARLVEQVEPVVDDGGEPPRPDAAQAGPEVGRQRVDGVDVRRERGQRAAGTDVGAGVGGTAWLRPCVVERDRRPRRQPDRNDAERRPSRARRDRGPVAVEAGLGAGARRIDGFQIDRLEIDRLQIVVIQTVVIHSGRT